jgi:hypothetical protein
VCKDIDGSINASIPVGGISLRNAAWTSGGGNSDPSVLVVGNVILIAAERFAEPVKRYVAVGIEFKIQWKPLNGITDNGINWLMESDFSKCTSPSFSVVAKVALQWKPLNGIALGKSKTDSYN